MQNLIAAIALGGLLASRGPAFAIDQTGAQFYDRCGKAAAAGVNAYCHDYLTGFYDALSEQGEMCPHTPPTDAEIVSVAQTWLRDHPANLGKKASYMIRNALENAWGCRRP
jgi:hypothetical protein